MLIATLAPAALWAQVPQTQRETRLKQLAYTREHYTKYEYQIPMRDGVKLFTTSMCRRTLRNATPSSCNGRHTPSRLTGLTITGTVLGPSEAAEKEGFIFVYQDVRGRYLSEGVFVDVRPHTARREDVADPDESTDTYDTIDWLVKNVPNNNGRVGIWGISYPGFFAAYSLINAHPALKAVSPQAPMGDVGNGDDSYHNGAFYLAANFGFYAGFKPRKPDPERPQRTVPFDPGTLDAYDFFLRMGPLANANEKYLKHKNVYWDDNIEHASYDEFWQARALAPHMKNVKPAVMWVGGWFDAEDLSGPLKLFDAVEKNGAQRSQHAGDGAMAAWRLVAPTPAIRSAISTSIPKPATFSARTSNCRSSCRI